MKQIFEILGLMWRCVWCTELWWLTLGVAWSLFVGAEPILLWRLAGALLVLLLWVLLSTGEIRKITPTNPE
ncbi:MAG: hypothetical protein HYZ63_00960 [Candidatus Andersenbacteria bacterium]|nr:hypothetical protein [Candidatus Andersenbacteria bacterium]